MFIVDQKLKDICKKLDVNPVPNYKREGDSGADIRACIDVPITLKPFERSLVPTGIKMEIPFGVDISVRPRSGLCDKYGVTVLNAPGTVDSNYKGEIKVNIINLGGFPYTIQPGERIAQLVAMNLFQMNCVEIDKSEHTKSERNEDGHGSSGTI